MDAIISVASYLVLFLLHCGCVACTGQVEHRGELRVSRAVTRRGSNVRSTEYNKNLITVKLTRFLP